MHIVPASTNRDRSPVAATVTVESVKRVAARESTAGTTSPHPCDPATSVSFFRLAVAVAFHAGLFNIGGEGQATLGGLGVALVCLMLPWPHWSVAFLAATVSAARA